MAPNKKRKKRLRSGYTTGACAAAAAKAAALLLLANRQTSKVTIVFPDNRPHTFVVNSSQRVANNSATASTIKDAGDDPDVTNGAEIFVNLTLLKKELPPAGHSLTSAQVDILFQAGEGIGTVTKPGLAISPGEPAINPVPRSMIFAAIQEAVVESHYRGDKLGLAITVSIPNGQLLAEKTLNSRLGILGGLSILGTTGIVRPISAEAWTATISACMDVAKKTGCQEIVISTGRTSEKAAQTLLDLPEEAYAMMGDYLKFSLDSASRHQFKKIHLSAMWAKIVKAAMAIPQTHVRHGALEAEHAAEFIGTLAKEPGLTKTLRGANTAREIYQRLEASNRRDVIRLVCLKAKEYAQEISALDVEVYLVDISGKVVEKV